MLDRPPTQHGNSTPQDRGEAIFHPLAKFAVKSRQFRIVLIENSCGFDDPIRDIQEITRFNMLGLTLAVVEDTVINDLEGETRNMIARLTGREATKNVAHKLRISEWTVGSHLRRIFAKLGVDNRAAMVYRCASLIDNAPKPEVTKSRETAPAG
jgi:Bacterial regulatory proteins, luxR family